MILLLDNKDSFVWNLAQALRQLSCFVEVVRSDEVDEQSLANCDAIVVSPGPGRPQQAGRSLEIIRAHSGRVPILGVCLGHQAIAEAFGADIVRGAPVHGRTFAIRHNGTGLFHGLPQPMHACRYHSLYAQAPLPADLLATAHTERGEVMALQHRKHPTFGVQFHPESFRTEHGSELLQNFVEML